MEMARLCKFFYHFIYYFCSEIQETEFNGSRPIIPPNIKVEGLEREEKLLEKDEKELEEQVERLAGIIRKGQLDMLTGDYEVKYQRRKILKQVEKLKKGMENLASEKQKYDSDETEVLITPEKVRFLSKR